MGAEETLLERAEDYLREAKREIVESIENIESEMGSAMPLDEEEWEADALLPRQDWVPISLMILFALMMCCLLVRAMPCIGLRRCYRRCCCRGGDDDTAFSPGAPPNTMVGYDQMEDEASPQPPQQVIASRDDVVGLYEVSPEGDLYTALIWHEGKFQKVAECQRSKRSRRHSRSGCAPEQRIRRAVAAAAAAEAATAGVPATGLWLLPAAPADVPAGVPTAAAVAPRPSAGHVHPRTDVPSSV